MNRRSVSSTEASIPGSSFPDSFPKQLPGAPAEHILRRRIYVRESQKLVESKESFLNAFDKVRNFVARSRGKAG